MELCSLSVSARGGRRAAEPVQAAARVPSERVRGCLPTGRGGRWYNDVPQLGRHQPWDPPLAGRSWALPSKGELGSAQQR